MNEDVALLARRILDELSTSAEIRDLTIKHMRFLMRIAEAEERGEKVRAADLAAEMGVQPSNASRILSDLSGHSKRLPEPLVRVDIDDENRRHRLLSLTTAAKRLRNRNKKALAVIVRDIFDLK